MAQHLLVAADRYGLHRLKLICEARLCGGIDVGTAATTLALAEQHDCCCSRPGASSSSLDPLKTSMLSWQRRGTGIWRPAAPWCWLNF